MQVVLFLSLVTVALAWSHNQSINYTGLTCATNKQLEDIYQLVKKWNESSVLLNSTISNSTTLTYEGISVNQTYKLESQRHPSHGLAKLVIQSGSETYADVRVKPGFGFGKNNIRYALILSGRQCLIKKLDKPVDSMHKIVSNYDGGVSKTSNENHAQNETTNQVQ